MSATKPLPAWTGKEPSDEAQCAARMARAYPSLPPYAAASLAAELCAIERLERADATNACNYNRSEAQEKRAESRIRNRLERWHAYLAEWGDGATAEIKRGGDPRGAVLWAKFPGEQEARAV